VEFFFTSGTAGQGVGPAGIEHLGPEAAIASATAMGGES
jgi:hypothetical protein